MLERVEFINAGNQTLALSLRGENGGYTVEKISGLDPVRASLITSEVATIDGTQYQTSSLDPRNIIATIGIEDTEESSVRELRQNLYNFFMPKTEITLRFVDEDGSMVQITGRTETFTSDLFTKEPQGVVSIVNFDPAFYSPNQSVFQGQTTAGVTETPFTYRGTLDAGFVFNMTLPRPATEVSIFLKDRSGFIRAMEIIFPFQVNDTLEVSTVPNAKGIWLNRGGIRSSILYSLASGHAWGVLMPGDNTIRVGVTGLAIGYTLSYYQKFGGL